MAPDKIDNSRSDACCARDRCQANVDRMGAELMKKGEAVYPRRNRPCGKRWQSWFRRRPPPPAAPSGAAQDAEICEGNHDLLPIFATRGRLSEVLYGKRSISKEQAKKLAAFFRVTADLVHLSRPR